MTEKSVTRTLRFIREETIDMEPQAYAEYLDRLKEEISILQVLSEWDESFD